MTPPEAPAVGKDAGTAAEPPAVSVCLEVIRNRPVFLLAARAQRYAMPGFVLQARKRQTGETSSDCIRVGFTCTKKVGNAVARNRAKRRLREIARLVLPQCGQRGWDYVLIGRANITATRPFADMQADLKNALSRAHGARQ